MKAFLAFALMAGALACVPYSQVRGRCQSWVDQGLPYSQQRTHDGYRLDCSGFMTWCIYGGLGYYKPGLVTSTFPRHGEYISKAQLRPGNLMLNSAQHVLMFAGWATGDSSKYYAYEEGSKGAVYRVVPYPYWQGYNPSAYKPFRTTGEGAIC